MAEFNHSFYEKAPVELYQQKDENVIRPSKDICYDVTDEKQDITVKFKTKEITLYKNELHFMKIGIENNSNSKIKRSTVFLDDFEYNLHISRDKNSKEKRGSKLLQATLSNNSFNEGILSGNFVKGNEIPLIGNVSLFKYFHREIEISRNETDEVK